MARAEQEDDDEDEALTQGQYSTELTNENTFNVAGVLRDHILKCVYFKNTLVPLQKHEEVIEQIFEYADHAEPYSAGS